MNALPQELTACLQSHPCQAPEVVARSFREFGPHFAQTDAPLLGELSAVALQDEVALALASLAQPGHPICPLLLSAVHFLMLREPGHPFAAWFASISPAPRPVAEAGAPFKAFCRERWRDIAELVRTHTIQTTSVHRAATLLPGLARIHACDPRPLSIVEVGCGPGLNLIFDRYAYEYVGADGSVDRVGPAGSTVLLRTQMIGRRFIPPATLPPVGARVGVDLNPIDPRDRAQRDWIIACVRPEYTETLNAIRAGFDMLERDPVRTIRGDASIELRGLLDTLPDPICVVHSNTMYQWPQAAREAVDALLRERSAGRDIHMLGIEPLFEMPPELAARPRPTAMMASEVDYVLYRAGSSERTVTAWCEGFSRWLDLK
ncbi:MAG: DUF2332 domain-containing protein [Gammaproteobacteria bacterium]